MFLWCCVVLRAVAVSFLRFLWPDPPCVTLTGRRCSAGHCWALSYVDWRLAPQLWHRRRHGLTEMLLTYAARNISIYIYMYVTPNRSEVQRWTLLGGDWRRRRERVQLCVVCRVKCRCVKSLVTALFLHRTEWTLYRTPHAPTPAPHNSCVAR